MVAINAFQKQLGQAMGLANVSSQNDLSQITAFAKANGVNNVTSQNDLNQLLTKVKPHFETAPGSNTWVNPNNVLPNAGTFAGAPIAKPVAPKPAIPAAASNGSSSNGMFEAMMMQMNQQIAQQQQAFAMQQQQAQIMAQEQAAQMAEMMTTALAPAAPTDTAKAASGWQGAGDAAKKEVEALLLTSTATPSTVGVTPAGTPSGKDLAALMIA